MVTQSLELTTSPWFRDISNLKQSFGNWRNPLCVVFAWKGRRTSFSAVATAHVSFVQSSLVFAIFARSPLRLKYNYFNCVWCHGGFFFFFFNYLSIRHESSFGEQPLLSEISLFPCSAMFKIYIKSQRNKNKSDSYCERLQKKSSQVRPYIHIPQYLKFFRARRNM